MRDDGKLKGGQLKRAAVYHGPAVKLSGGLQACGSSAHG